MNVESRLDFDDTVQNAIVKLAEGNPGAALAMVRMVENVKQDDPDIGGFIPLLGLDALRLYGEAIYLLYNDVCSRSTWKVRVLLRSVQLGHTPGDDVRAMVADRFNRQPLTDEAFVQKAAYVAAELPNFPRQQPEYAGEDNDQ